MADEPSAGELNRRIDGLAAVTAQLVTRTEYAADRRYEDRRFVEVEKDVADMRNEQAAFRAQISQDLKELAASIKDAAEKRGSNAKQHVYNGLLPAVLVLLGIAVQIWLAVRAP